MPSPNNKRSHSQKPSSLSLPGSWEDRVSDALRFNGEIPPQPKRKRAKKVKKK